MLRHLLDLPVLFGILCTLLPVICEPCRWKVEVSKVSHPLTRVQIAALNHTSHAVGDTLRDLDVINIKHIAEMLCSYPYFLKLALVCNGKESPAMTSELILTGGHPVIKLQYWPWFEGSRSVGTVKNIINGAFVDLENFAGTDHWCPLGLCHPAWLAPLPLNFHTMVIDGEVYTEGMSHTWPRQRFILPITGTPVLYEAKLSVPPGIHQLRFLPKESSVLALPINQQGTLVVISHDNFESNTFIQLASLNESLTHACKNPVGSIVAVLKDQILVGTEVGVLSYANSTHQVALTTGEPVVVLEQCIRELVVPVQTAAQRRHLLAIGGQSDEGKLYAADLSLNIDRVPALNFTNLTPGDSTVCAVIAPGYPCVLVSATSSGIGGGSVTALLHVTNPVKGVRYVICEWTDSGNWTIKSEFPARRPDSPSSQSAVWLPEDSAGESFVLHSISVTQTLSTDLFLWGSVLLQSSDGGSSVFLLSGYTSTSTILLLVTSADGQFAFVNEESQVWYGVGRCPVLLQLYPSSAWDVVMATKPLAKDMEDSSIVSLFFDSFDNLRIVVTSVSDRSSLTAVTVPVGQILSHQHDCQNKLKASHKTEVAGAVKIKATSSCPYNSLSFMIPNDPTFTQAETLVYRPTALSNRYLSHSNHSLMVYQAVMHSLLEGHRWDDLVYEDPYKDHVTAWQDQLRDNQTFAQYLYQNNLLREGLHVDLTDYQQLYNSTRWTSSPHLPDVIYLNFREVYIFTVIIHPSEDNEAKDIENIQVSAVTTDPDNINVTVTRKESTFSGLIQYQVTVADRGTLLSQSRPGQGLYPTTFMLDVSDSFPHCFEEQMGTTKTKGHYQMAVNLGCSPNLRLVFDINATMNEYAKRQETVMDCIDVDVNMPCFNYQKDFYPLFKIVDETTGESWRFTGTYTLKVIGGHAESKEEITQYSEDTVFEYNNQQSLSGGLIWGPLDESLTREDGWPVYNYINNTVSWLCSSPAPCSNVMPKFPNSPQYYFLVEISNNGIGINRTHCDFTTQFILHINGLPLDLINASMVLVAWSISAILLITFLFYLCHCQEEFLIKQFSRIKFHKYRKRHVRPKSSSVLASKESLSDHATAGSQSDNPLVVPAAYIQQGTTAGNMYEMQGVMGERHEQPDRYDNDKVEHDMASAISPSLPTHDAPDTYDNHKIETVMEEALEVPGPSQEAGARPQAAPKPRDRGTSYGVGHPFDVYSKMTPGKRKPSTGQS